MAFNWDANKDAIGFTNGLWMVMQMGSIWKYRYHTNRNTNASTNANANANTNTNTYECKCKILALYRQYIKAMYQINVLNK